MGGGRKEKEREGERAALFISCSAGGAPCMRACVCAREAHVAMRKASIAGVSAGGAKVHTPAPQLRNLAKWSLLPCLP